jgi:uncharacterized protein (DUF849 family)
MREWTVLPDFISVNFDEDGAHEVADLMFQMGIGVEAGLNGPAAAKQFAAYPRNYKVLRILIEPQEQVFEDALQNASVVEEAIGHINLPKPYLLHGSDSIAWEMFRHAVANGYHVRMGFEDTFMLSNDVRARSNSELIAAASAVISGAVAT